jgi:tetratricopeptide (TPR) repeat protein
VDVDAYDLNMDSSSTKFQEAKQLALDFLSTGNYDGAISVGKVLLQRLKTGENHCTALSTLARQLALLCLAAGYTREASYFSAEALQSLPSIKHGGKTTEEEGANTVAVLLTQGLVQLSSNKVGQAVKVLHEATHMAIAVNGYQDSTVAALLNCIGVLHFETGDMKSSMRSLNESLEMQKAILSSGDANADYVDDAIYRLAMTMGNLAMACERSGQYDRAIGWLDESLALYESSVMDTSEMEEIVRKNLERILVEAPHSKQHLEDTAPTIYEDDSDEYDDEDDDDYDNEYSVDEEEDDDYVDEEDNEDYDSSFRSSSPDRIYSRCRDSFHSHDESL